MTGWAISMPSGSEETPNGRSRTTVDLLPAADNALRAAQAQLDTAQAHLTSLLTGIVAGAGISSGKVVAVEEGTPRKLVIEVDSGPVG
jgi:hypothetical protein